MVYMRVKKKIKINYLIIVVFFITTIYMNVKKLKVIEDTKIILKTSHHIINDNYKDNNDEQS